MYCDTPVPRKLPLSLWETLQCIAICLSQENCSFPWETLQFIVICLSRENCPFLTGKLCSVLRYASPKKIAPFSLGNFTVYCDMPFPRKLLLSPGNFTVYCDLPVPRKLPLSHWETLQCIAICLSQENCFFPLNFHRPGALPDAQLTASEH